MKCSIPDRVRKAVVVAGAFFCVSLIFAKPSVAGPCTPDRGEAPGVYVPDRGCFQLGIGYEYEHFNVLGTSFHDHAYTANFTMHLFDAVTGATGRLTVGAEGALDAGFGGHTTGTPSSDAKSFFVGAGPHAALETNSRFEPWVHGLVGLQHFRFTQGAVLGSNSALGFKVGGGVDIRLAPRISWRVEGDYVGSDFQSGIQSNYSAGTGIVLHF
jgi:opacity protein-like surface antigen